MRRTSPTLIPLFLLFINLIMMENLMRTHLSVFILTAAVSRECNLVFFSLREWKWQEETKRWKHEKMKTLQLSFLIHRAKILIAAKSLPGHFQIALLRALHNHDWFLPGTGLPQKSRAFTFLHYLDYLFTCAAINTMHGSYNTLRSSLKQWIQAHFMHRG